MPTKDLDLLADAEEGTVTFSLAKSQYSMEALQIAAHIFDRRAEVRFDESKTEYEITLEAKRKKLDAPALEAIGGEFVNELLNQEYRFVVGKFNQKISTLIVAQALLAARGGEAPAGLPPEEQTPEFQAEVAALMAESAAEIARTMPRKLPPQGSIFPPEKEPLA